MAANQREEIIRRAGEICRLRENIASLQAELQSREKEFDDLLLDVSPATTLFSRPSAFSEKLKAALQPIADPAEDKSLNQQIIDVLAKGLEPGEDADAETLLCGLPDGTNLTSLRSALARLADQGKIRRTTRGRYASLPGLPPEPSAQQALP